MVKKNVICITKKKKNDDNYVVCFNKSNKKIRINLRNQRNLIN